jgi:SAM-dependent methyltransferase
LTRESEQIVDLYERHAGAFDRKRGRTLFEKSWLDRFAALVVPHGNILDIGCGMGEPIARYLIERGFHLTGIDSSPTMIALSSRRFPAHLWHIADMRGLALGQAFDGLIAFDSFFHLSPGDQRSMFAIFRDHATPGAPLMFTSGPTFGEAIGSFEGEPLYHASLSPEEYRTLLAGNGFSIVDHAVEDPDCGKHTIWLARRDKGG